MWTCILVNISLIQGYHEELVPSDDTILHNTTIKSSFVKNDMSKSHVGKHWETRLRLGCVFGIVCTWKFILCLWSSHSGYTHDYMVWFIRDTAWWDHLYALSFQQKWQVHVLTKVNSQPVIYLPCHKDERGHRGLFFFFILPSISVC